jgi:hypothetical protein
MRLIISMTRAQGLLFAHLTTTDLEFIKGLMVAAKVFLPKDEFILCSCTCSFHSQVRPNATKIYHTSVNSARPTSNLQYPGQGSALHELKSAIFQTDI